MTERVEHFVWSISGANRLQVRRLRFTPVSMRPMSGWSLTHIVTIEAGVGFEVLCLTV